MKSGIANKVSGRDYHDRTDNQAILYGGGLDQEALQEEIISRLGEDGRDMMETLSGLNLELEDIHDEALFRAAMELGAQIAQPRRGGWTAEGLQ